MATLNIALQNKTSSRTVYAYITGRAIDNNNALFLLRSNAQTPYYPTSPGSPGQKLGQDCAIPLGAPGNTVVAKIPHIAGGRIWFSIDQPLAFALNPGPALVEPAVANPNDPNDKIQWDFCEFTWNSFQLYVNISYVDFVSVPISLALKNAAGATHTVGGLNPNGLDAICAGLQAQQKADNAGWSSLIVKKGSGANLRALSPNAGISRNRNLFSGFYQSYVDHVWRKYASSGATRLDIATQGQWGTVRGSVNSAGLLDFGRGITFTKPSAADIFSCSTGPFAASSNIEKGAIIARLSAAFNRSTLLHDTVTPRGAPSQYYTEKVTNHYSRLVHAANIEGRGYAFPFDDVAPDGGIDQSGSVFDSNPRLLTVAIGGHVTFGPVLSKQPL